MGSKCARTDTLEIAYEEHGPQAGAAAILLHGFPYDARAFDQVAPTLAADDRRVLVPYLRGYGATHFLSDAMPRSGEQAALGHDLLQFMDALGIQQATLAGYDWGGRAALTKDRRDLCRLLWTLWSPEWRFDEATFEKSAVSFDNPDFVEVVIQSYRHRYGNAPGDPALAAIEARLAQQPRIAAPTINLHGGHDGVDPAPERDDGAAFFTGPYERRLLPRIGHNVPQEAPDATVAALRDLMKVA